MIDRSSEAQIELQKQEILRKMSEGMQALGASLAGIGESDVVARPAPGEWSVLDCVEHLSASEALLLIQLRAAWPCTESHEDLAREAKFQGLALNRERKIEAPEPVRPTGQCATLAEAVARFEAVRRETVNFIEQFEGDLRWSLAQHPLIPRPVNCYEMLLLMALHPIRHAAQITQIRALGPKASHIDGGGAAP